MGNDFGVKTASNSAPVSGQNASLALPAALSREHLAPCVHQHYWIFVGFLMNHRWCAGGSSLKLQTFFHPAALVSWGLFLPFVSRPKSAFAEQHRRHWRSARWSCQNDEYGKFFSMLGHPGSGRHGLKSVTLHGFSGEVGAEGATRGSTVDYVI